MEGAPTEVEFVKWLATLGVGGIIAAIIFFFYRRDIRQYTELWKTTTEQLLTVVKENTKSHTELIGLIETKMSSTDASDIRYIKEKLERIERDMVAARVPAKRPIPPGPV